jgi:aquaporin related protein
MILLTLVLMVTAKICINTITMDQEQQQTTKMLDKVSLRPAPDCCLLDFLFHEANLSPAREMTDGANETDFATRLQHAKRNPAMQKRQPKSPDHNTSMDAAADVKSSAPMPAFLHGGDGHHRSDSDNDSLDHPNDRPRAQHTHSSRRSSQSNYEIASDRSYRNGPSAESGKSSS